MNLNYRSWHYRLVNTYTTKYVYSGISFCKYTLYVLLGMLSVLGTILAASLVLATPLVCSGIGYIGGLDAAKECAITALRGPFLTGNVPIDFLVMIALIFSLTLTAVMTISVIVWLGYTFFVFLGAAVYDMCAYYQNKKHVTDDDKPDTTSLVIQWIKAKHKKVCPTVKFN